MDPNPPGPGQQSQRQAPVYDPNVGGHYGLSIFQFEIRFSRLPCLLVDLVLRLMGFLQQVQVQRYVM